MTRDRFHFILSNIHFSDVNYCVSKDIVKNKKFKVLDLYSESNKIFKCILTPGRDLTLDESMCAFKGRLSFKMFIPSKRTWYGIKSFRICTPSGYVIEDKLYTGKDPDNVTPKIDDLVLNIMEPFKDSGKTLYADNYYSSVNICLTLLERDTYFCGTIKANRKKLPKFPNKMLKGEYSIKFQNRV